MRRGLFGCAAIAAFVNYAPHRRSCIPRKRQTLLSFGRRCAIKYLIHISSALAVLAIASTVWAGEPTEDEVVDTIKGMFHSFSVESDDRNNFYDFVTNDFVIYEMGEIFNASEFLALDSFNTIEDDWEFSNFEISIDNESAHAYFRNTGRFITLNEGEKRLLNKEWLESAYLVRVNGKLKIKFYFSDVVNQSSEEIE